MSSVCVKIQSFEWHSHSCLLRTCKLCPQPLFCRCELDVEICHVVKWKNLEYVITNIAKGLVRKRNKQIYKETWGATIVLECKKQLGECTLHNFKSY